MGIFALGFPFPFFEMVGKVLFMLFLAILLFDIIFLYVAPNELEIKRIVKEQLSNGDENTIEYEITGKFNFIPRLQLIDEYPAQLQLRNCILPIEINGKVFKQAVSYSIFPKQRGEYIFGHIKIMQSTKFGLLNKMVSFPKNETIKVVPSIQQYKKFSFLAYTNRLEEAGIKKVRKIGSSTDFEQINEFQRGDNIRRINWKATARRNTLMVNHYEDQKAQNIYFLLDKGRMMHMPFNGLSLFDYAVNSSLSMAGVARHKGDKVGLITFSDVIGTWLPAQSIGNQVSKISQELYHQKIRQKDTDFSRLYKNIRLRMKGRSMLILYTNFDSMVSLNRQMKYLKAISKSHLLVIVSFLNEEIVTLANHKTNGERNFFDQSIAEKFLQEKQRINQELNMAGIYTISTLPEDLTVNSINTYLKIKSRGLL
ncbi:MAG: hypothetical protein ACJARP_001011 [Vicingaceae bacterium]